MRQYLPWQLKIAIKVVLVRLPIPYGVWARAGFFKHGQMETADYARKVFSIHMEEAKAAGISANGVYLEMGAGDSVASALMAHARGAGKTILVDVGPFATRDMGYYRDLTAQLKAEGGNVPEITEQTGFEDMLAQCHAEYLTQGLASLKTLPDSSVDFIWSHATLEHVRRREFAETMRETFRILKPGGAASHNIDLKDHLGGALNNLRFKESTWEAEWMARSGFYTNRIRCSEMMRIFAESGFVIEKKDFGRWETLPTPKAKMAEPFRGMPDEDLLIRGFSVLLRKPA